MTTITKCVLYLSIVTFIVSIKIYLRVLADYEMKLRRVKNNIFIISTEKIQNYKLRTLKNIIFLETSQQTMLNIKTVCAIESAVRLHMDLSVHLYMTARKYEDQIFSILRTFQNVNLKYIDLKKYVAGTPFERIISSGALNASKWKTSHSSDILRLLTLLNRGGVYLDTDVIVVKRLDTLGGNFLGMESERIVGTNVLGISNRGIGRKFLKEAIRLLSLTFDGSKFLQNGPKLIKIVLRKFCKDEIISLTKNQTCKGFRIYPVEYFNPIHYARSISLLYDTEKQLDITNPNTHVVHFWGSLTSTFNITEYSLYARLMRRYCPTTFHKGRGHVQFIYPTVWRNIN